MESTKRNSRRCSKWMHLMLARANASHYRLRFVVLTKPWIYCCCCGAFSQSDFFLTIRKIPQIKWNVCASFHSMAWSWYPIMGTLYISSKRWPLNQLPDRGKRCEINHAVPRSTPNRKSHFTKRSNKFILSAGNCWPERKHRVSCACLLSVFACATVDVSMQTECVRDWLAPSEVCLLLLLQTAHGTRYSDLCSIPIQSGLECGGCSYLWARRTLYGGVPCDCQFLLWCRDGRGGWEELGELSFI